jgi:hypothetical protein
LHKGIAWAAGVYNVAYGKMARGKGLDLLERIILHNAKVMGEWGESGWRAVRKFPPYVGENGRREE